MNTKRFLTLCFVAIITIAMTAPASWAGSAQRHRLEGAVIGIGALLLTKAIIDHSRDAYAAPARPAAQPYYPQPAGYWDTQREWVPPTYKKVWNPGHYNVKGRWVPGRWIQIEVESGYWAERKVWVPYH